METSSTEWVKFFKDSGLPNAVSTKYAVIFSNHRIQFDMLKDLTKEILYDMGIKTMGDVIAILRHAKNVDEEATKAQILGKGPEVTGLNKEQLVVKPLMESTLKRKSTETTISTRPKIRKILPPKEQSDGEGYEYMSEGSTYVIKMPNFAPQTNKPTPPTTSSIFTRLGSQEQMPNEVASTASTSSVFARLGASAGTQNKIRIINTSPSKGTVLRGAEGATSSFTLQPRKATATVKPTNLLIRKSLAEATGKPHVSRAPKAASPLASFNASTSVKNRLGNRVVTSTNQLGSSKIMTSKKLAVTKESGPKKNTLSLKKSIFDRLGPMTL